MLPQTKIAYEIKGKSRFNTCFITDAVQCISPGGIWFMGQAPGLPKLMEVHWEILIARELRFPVPLFKAASPGCTDACLLQ